MAGDEAAWAKITARSQDFHRRSRTLKTITHHAGESSRRLSCLRASASRLFIDQPPWGTLLGDRRGTGLNAGQQSESQDYVATQFQEEPNVKDTCFAQAYGLVRSCGMWICGLDGEWPVDDAGWHCRNGRRRDQCDGPRGCHHDS